MKNKHHTTDNMTSELDLGMGLGVNNKFNCCNTFGEGNGAGYGSSPGGCYGFSVGAGNNVGYAEPDGYADGSGSMWGAGDRKGKGYG